MAYLSLAVAHVASGDSVFIATTFAINVSVVANQRFSS